MATEPTQFQRVLPQSDSTTPMLKVDTTASPNSHQSSPAESPAIPPRTPTSSQAPPAWQSQRPTSQQVKSEQPTVEFLACHGIKVRDFAYESTLPPIPTYYLQKRQVQPGLTSLKRERTEEGDDGFSQPENSQRRNIPTKKLRLERTCTEPMEDFSQSQHPTSQSPMRTRGFVNIQDYDSDDLSYLQSQPSAYTNSQPQPHYDLSQEGNPFVDTPVVTPNGSLQWLEPSQRQVEGSQRTSAQPTVATPRTLSLRLQGSQTFSTISSPLSSPPSSQVINLPKALPTASFSYRKPKSNLRRPSDESPLQSPVTSTSNGRQRDTSSNTSSTQTRYQLRERRPLPARIPYTPANTTSKVTTTKATINTNAKRAAGIKRKISSTLPTSVQPNRPLTRSRTSRILSSTRAAPTSPSVPIPNGPPTFSRQSAHAKSKLVGGGPMGSPSSRTLKTKTKRKARTAPK